MAKRLKIVFLSKYLGVVNRGAETYVKELSERLRKNHDVEILKGDDAYNLSKIINGKFDIVIPTNGRSQSLKASLGKIMGAKYKVVISGQSGIGRDDIWNIFTKPDAYVALTRMEEIWAKKWAWGTKVVKISNGIDLDKFSPKGKKVDLNLSGPIILSVGALEWYKHHELTIKAMSRLEIGSLVIVGAGSLEKDLMELGDKLLGKRFKIIQTNYDQIPDIYRSADLFCLPSWDREAFGIVYLEALASNLPVVAPNDSPRREIVGAGGLLVDVNDPEKYAEAINNALNKKWNDLPRKQAEQFNWDKIASEYEKLFEELI